MATKKEYLDFVNVFHEELLRNYEQSLKEWRERMETADSFDPPMVPVARALVEGFLYHVTGNKEYAEKAREAMLTYQKLPDMVPERMRRMPKYAGGIRPMLNWFGGVTLFLRAYEFIRDSGVIRWEDREVFKQIVGNSLEPFFSFPEWGPHNRAIKRGLALMYAAKIFPDHPDASKWNKLGKLMVEPSLKHWSLEDSELYVPIWLSDLLLYLDVTGDWEVLDSPIMKYYFHYFTNLLCPLGMIPDFGDATWGANAELYLAILEKGASTYRDPHMKYAADRIFRFALKEKKLGIYAIFAYLWSDDTVETKVPVSCSQEVLDEVIGKKIVFREGWDEDATYMLLNYMDEGDIGWYYKEHLRNTLVVTSEKMHHGHADENSIITLLKNGAFLLHDGGYREALPNGAYRADVYHNRVVVRHGRPSGQRLFEFLHDKGVYQPVRTRRVHFKKFQDVDVSRTEVIDERNGYHWDRVITFLKDLKAFVIHDGVKLLRDGEFTISNLLWTQNIHATGKEYFDTSIDLIGTVGAMSNVKTLEERKRFAWPNKKGERLLIYFQPDGSKEQGVDETMRCYLPEKCVYQTYSNRFRRGEFASFTTFLLPHGEDEAIDTMISKLKRVKVNKYPNATAIRIEQPNGAVYICVKHDLSIGLVRPETRPVYTYEAGEIQYDEFATDAAYLYAKLNGSLLKYAFIDGMKLLFKNKRIFSSEEPSVINLTHRPDIDREGAFKTEKEYWKFELKTKWDSWEDEAEV
ncbi:MAG: heparinase II/III family protein [Thermoproteota archaeon]